MRVSKLASVTDEQFKEAFQKYGSVTATAEHFAVSPPTVAKRADQLGLRGERADAAPKKLNGTPHPKLTPGEPPAPKPATHPAPVLEQLSGTAILTRAAHVIEELEQLPLYAQQFVLNHVNEQRTRQLAAAERGA